MKTLLLLLLSCLPLCAATTYTVLSDNTNRTITGGTTNLSFLNATNQVFTGTNTFAPAGFFPANGISRRLLLFTNINSRVDAFTNAVAPTGPGGFADCGKVAMVMVPPLLGTRSLVFVSYQLDKTNATLSSYQPLLYGGVNTNWLSYLSGLSAGGTPQALFTGMQLPAFANAGSFTSQYQNAGSIAVSTQLSNPTNCVDTSVAWPLYFGVTSTAGATNVLFMSLLVEELVVP